MGSLHLNLPYIYYSGTRNGSNGLKLRMIAYNGLEWLGGPEYVVLDIHISMLESKLLQGVFYFQPTKPKTRANYVFRILSTNTIHQPHFDSIKLAVLRI